MAKSLRLGARLHYPITISRVLKNPGDNVQKQERILQYTFKFERKVGDPELGNERVNIETGVADFDSPVEGKLQRYHVKVGDVIQRDQDVVSIEEECSHDIQCASLCARCGKDMTETNWAADTLDTQRATVAMVHDNVSLMVSRSQAVRAEVTLQRRLLKDRKLSLVVDLDQTIIHACIEPTVGEWQADPTNPNHEAVKDVCKFQLDDGPRGLASGCWYYIKMRPGLAEFLQKVSEMFEMHIYTMGTRAYALSIAKIVDPTQKLFGNRIISRDENGSMTAKTLQRLFPVSTSMVVVIDDRADVWPQNRPNLIKVTPYDFFKGIGDINSSFLPKREDVIAAPPPTQDPQPQNPSPPASTQAQSNGVDGKPPSPLEGQDEGALLQLQAEEQERTLEKQLTDRPLAQLQEKLDKEDEVAERESAEGGEVPESAPNGDPESSPHHRHNLLRDDDQELFYLENHLTTLHRSFYEQYDARSANHRPEEISADTIPDVGATLSFLKSQVLRGTRIVLSGLVPLGTDVRRSEIGIQAESFGTEIHTRVSENITHLVISAARQRTQKVRQAARIPTIKIVNQNWLADSLAQWKKLDETPYLIDIHPSDRRGTTPLEEGEEGEDGMGSRPVRPRITIVRSGQQNIPQQNGAVDDGDENEEDESGGDGEDEDDGDGEDEDGEVEDRYNVMPPELEDGDRSPIKELAKMEWESVDKELEEFMGSDADDSDMDSVTEFGGGDTDREDEQRSLGLKRKYGDDLEEEEEAGGSEGRRSALAKKQRLAKARITGLRNVKNVADDENGVGGGEAGSGLPTPMGTGDGDDNGTAVNGGEDEVERGVDGEDDDDDDDDGFSDLEAEFEAEFEELQAGMDDAG